MKWFLCSLEPAKFRTNTVGKKRAYLRKPARGASSHAGKCVSVSLQAISSSLFPLTPHLAPSLRPPPLSGLSSFLPLLDLTSHDAHLMCLPSSSPSTHFLSPSSPCLSPYIRVYTNTCKHRTRSLLIVTLHPHI